MHERRGDLKWLAIVVLCAVTIGLGVRFLIRPSRASPSEVRRELWDELRPVTLKNCTLARFGGPGDGGYLMCGNLLGNIEGAYSYGIGGTDDWGCEIGSRFGLPVHQYDCFNLAQPVCNDGGRFVFHAECIGPGTTTIESRLFDTLANQILKNGHGGKRLVVKMDVEGAEWDSLLATPDAVLNQIDQLPMEFHGIEEQRFPEVVRKLKRTFHLVHLHFNNMACTAGLEPFPAFALQVLFVNKRIGILDDSAGAPSLPRALDAPDVPDRPDCQSLPNAPRAQN
jgi:hypothetical protein